MFVIDNPQEIYVDWESNYSNRTYHVVLYSEKELIRFIAQGYRETFYYDLDILCHDINHNKRFYYSYVDSYNRKIEPRAYKLDAWNYYSRFLRHQVKSDKSIYWKSEKYYKGRFRREPVEGIHKPRGWKNGRNRGPRLRQVVAMYKDPEQKPFNRGCRFEFPWWDDCFREPQKCWKEQRKVRHQWER